MKGKKRKKEEKSEGKKGKKGKRKEKANQKKTPNWHPTPTSRLVSSRHCQSLMRFLPSPFPPVNPSPPAIVNP
jgi:hypothetical protein